MLKIYFNLKVWKIIVLLVTFIYGVIKIRGPLCIGGNTCNVPFLIKIISYSSSVLLPGTTQLMRDNGFLIGHKTYDIWDAIPQLIFHIGIDIFYWYLIICVIVYLIHKIKGLPTNN
jgi:hypothetical protein